jgi:ABC-type antimicrobial peptide transport system permease subunit
MAALGIVIGLAAAAGATQLLASLLYGIRPLDPASFSLGAAVFGVLALVASWLPARRAASVNPVEALRRE